MKIKKSFPLAVIYCFLCSFVFSFPLESPSWGFMLDIPEEYKYKNGDGKDTFSFEGPDGAKLDISVYDTAKEDSSPYSTLEELARDVQSKLNSSGVFEAFTYREKKAFLLNLEFTLPGTGPILGWALCIELGAPKSVSSKPMLLAMAYGPASKKEIAHLHLSALDSIAPEYMDRLVPGPITEFTYPREKRVKTPIFGLDLEAWIFEEDAGAAQALIDREFEVLRRYENAPAWKDAWIRFYRMIYRDSFERLIDIAFQVERKLNVPSREDRDFAEQVLKWVQSFEYERDLLGSDFINLVSAAAEGRGDCDNRAMLWAMVLTQAGIPGAIMVSRHYSHAMGLAELPGTGARFEVEGKKLLVAETTADVSIGLIGETVSDIEHWLGVLFE